MNKLTIKKNQLNQFFSTNAYLVMRINHLPTIVALLPAIFPRVARYPTIVTFFTFETAKDSLRALIWSTFCITFIIVVILKNGVYGKLYFKV